MLSVQIENHGLFANPSKNLQMWVFFFLWRITWLVNGYETAVCRDFAMLPQAEEREMRKYELKLGESSVNKLRSADILIYKETITFKHVLSI